MSTFDTTKWYKHQTRTNLYRPLVTEPDGGGILPVATRNGSYCVVTASNLTLIPERFTVELRLPKAGEFFVDSYGQVDMAAHDYEGERLVIVDDEVTA